MSAPLPNRRRGLVWAFASAVGGGVMAIPWKLANEIGDPAHSTLLLLLVAAIANTALVLGQRLRSGTARLALGRTELAVAAALATMTLLGNDLSAYAIKDLSPALHTVLLRTDVIFVAILGGFLLAEKVEGRFWVGAAIAGVGLVVLQGPVGEGGLRALLGSGTGLAIGAAFCFSALAVMTRRFIHRIDPVAVNALRLWIAVAMWFALNAMPALEEIPLEQVFYAGIAALTGPFLGRLALMMSARDIEARLTTLVTLSTPVMTLLLAFLLLDDWPETHQLLGGAIMIGGIAIPLLRMRREAPARA